MNVKRMVLLFVFVTTMITLLSCSSKPVNWEFPYTSDHVTEIKIVNYDIYGTCTDLKKIDVNKADELYSDIGGLVFHKYFGEPAEHVGDCFYIAYDNGEYVVISRVEPRHHFTNPENGKPNSYFSRLACEKEPFNILIDKYLQNDDI